MARPRWKRLFVALVKWSATLLVLWYVARHVSRTWNDLNHRATSLHFDAAWLAGSGVLYLAGLCAYGLFYQRILEASPTPIAIMPALRAYLISHLGKYVPGKAMVVIVRAGLVAPFGARPATAAIATFYETLVMMAAGGWIATAGFAMASFAADTPDKRIELAPPGYGAVSVPIYPVAAVSALMLGVLFLITVLPITFGKLTRAISVPIPGVGPDAMPRLSFGLLTRGIAWSLGGWVLLGLSLLAVVGSFLPMNLSDIIERGLVPVGIASVAFATIAGFLVAVLPGGLGVREGVLMSTLVPILGPDDSVVAALMLRLVWVAAEVVAALVFFAALRPPRASSFPPSGSGQSSL
jgi:uncharacterized membrane protein YbhN (UPF0104 family)